MFKTKPGFFESPPGFFYPGGGFIESKHRFFESAPGFEYQPYGMVKIKPKASIAGERIAQQGRARRIRLISWRSLRPSR